MSPSQTALRHVTRNALAQLLEHPHLEQQVAQLRGGELKTLVTAVGIEDAGELLALASGDQLLELMDEDVWVPDPLCGETIDAARFATFLEVLQEGGAATLAQRLGSLSEDFLALALGKLVTVWPTQFIEQHAAADEDGLIEKKLDNQLIEEFDSYCVLSSTGAGWDALIALLTTWNESNPELLDRLLSRLAAAATSQIEAPADLVNALDGMAQLQEEAEAEREERRAALGYVSLNDARAFLRLPPVKAPGEKDAISAAYFRRLSPQKPDDELRAKPSAIFESLRGQLGDARESLEEPASLLKQAMTRLQEEQPDAHGRCLEELAFLVNVVVSEQALRGHDINPAKALRTVTSRLERGCPSANGSPQAGIQELVDALLTWTPIGLFRRSVTS